MNQPPVAPDAQLLLAPACPHCPAVLEGLAGLVKEGVIGRLEVVNIALHPEQAAALEVRTVPWTRIGEFELEGVQTPGELRRWAEFSGTLRGMPEFFLHLLRNGRRDKVEAMARQQPQRLLALVTLLAEAESSMAVRLGIGAVLEEFQGDSIAEVMIPGLGELTRHADALTRADACHYLSLIGGEAIVPYLKDCLADESVEVREIAAETLADMGAQ
ncbi:MAG: HEAT repeat domain-containing protein [Sulfuricella denitrificans]|nr:HEAT repeat domain-containing protein [Sulfuricella denitrificans]